MEFVMDDLVQQGLTPSEGMEVWVMQTNGNVWLETLGHNRFGQPIAKPLRIGPNRAGFEFMISAHDRLENQRQVVDPKNDPFRNGTFVRRDKSQAEDPNTQSDDALTTEDLLDICDLEQAKFEARVERMGEIPLRRLLELAESMDIGHRKVVFLQDTIKARYHTGSPQKSLVGHVDHLS